MLKKEIYFGGTHDSTDQLIFQLFHERGSREGAEARAEEEEEENIEAAGKKKLSAEAEAVYAAACPKATTSVKCVT